jgi:hypothetical protein
MAFFSPDGRASIAAEADAALGSFVLSICAEDDREISRIAGGR